VQRLAIELVTPDGNVMSTRRFGLFEPKSDALMHRARLRDPTWIGGE